MPAPTLPMPIAKPPAPVTPRHLACLMQKVSRAFREAGVTLEPPAPRK